MNLVFILFYITSLVSALYSENTEEAIRKLILKLPILCFPLLLSIFKSTQTTTRVQMLQIFLFSLYIPAFVSVFNYFRNKTLYDQLILESKPLPIEFGYGIYHIQFSILLAASILLGIYLLINRRQFSLSKMGLWFTGIMILFNFIFIHILSARTGLLSLYTGLIMLSMLEFKRLPLKYKTISIISAISVPLLMIALSTSLQNRLKNTMDDLQVVWQGKDANDYSFAMRVQAWRNALDVIQNQPFKGVGIGDADLVLHENYGKFNPQISVVNRKNPHFQILETAVQSGLISALLFLIIIMILKLKSLKGEYLPASIAVMLFMASCFESILERQASVIGFSILIALSIAFSIENGNKKAIAE